MSIMLKNCDLQLILEIAGEKYKHCRFDWNGLVSQIYFKGIPLLSEEKPEGERNPARFGRGLHNEFGIRKVIGYDEIAAGEWFPKIGTGWLKKDCQPYFFYNDYEMEPFTFFTESDIHSSVFTCTSGERNGYSFDYVKKIEIGDNGFTISYTLQNRGSKPLITDEYSHNFLCFNHNKQGPAYKLSFPYELQPAGFLESNNPGGLVQFAGNSLFLSRETTEQYSFTGLSGGLEVAALWTLSHEKEKLSLTEKGDFTTSRINLWGWGHVISPELFYDFTLNPGEKVEWNRAYSVEQL